MNAAWRYASENGPFNDRTKISGWPETFKPNQIAFLQYGNDEKRKKALHDQLVADCESGRIECLVSEYHPEYVQSSGGWTCREDDDDYRVSEPSNPADLFFSVMRNKPDPDGWIKRYHIAAPQVAKFLKDQGFFPSENIRAWFIAVFMGWRDEYPDFAKQANDETQEVAPTVNAAPVSAGSSANEEPNNLDQVKWTPELLKKTRYAFGGDGKGKPMKRLVEASGIKEREIRRRIAGIKEPEINPNTPFQLLPRQNAGYRRA